MPQTTTPDAVTAESAAGHSPEEVREQLLASVKGQLKLPAVGMAYKLAALVVLAVMLLMPLLYAAVIGAVACGMVWLAIGSFGQSLAAPVFWIAEIGLGLVLVALLKPLIEPQRRPAEQYSKKLSEEPLLAAIVWQICEQVDAPAPSMVQWECSTRIAASGRRGGVLTIGLPLLACLTAEQFAGAAAVQLALVRRRAATRITRLIRAINGWLWRSVYGESRFDHWLAIVVQRPHFHLAKLLLPLRAAKLVAQAVLFVPMFVANTVGGYVVRRAELDADLIAARLVGRKTFSVLLAKVEAADFLWAGVLAELDLLRREGILPEGLPQQLASRMHDVTPELAATLGETVNRPEEIPFDTRATTQERLATTAKEPAEGVFGCPLPARHLAADYDVLSRKMTWDYYVARFGSKFLRTAETPVAAPSSARVSPTPAPPHKGRK